MTTSVRVNFSALSINCADSAALAQFWGKALGRPVSPGKVAGDTAVDTADPENGPRMIFHNIPEPTTGNNGFQLVLATENYDEEIERLTGLGARPLTETKRPGVRWTTLADPEGNEFDLANWQSE
jgi:predicted enzyme related to lactoylglutathione lyase